MQIPLLARACRCVESHNKETTKLESSTISGEYFEEIEKEDFIDVM